MNRSPSLDRPARKPAWLKVSAPKGRGYSEIKALRKGLGLATVCEEARCPNIGECWDGGTATFMLLGDTCTRHCRFCNVKTGNPRGRTDEDEPAKVAEAVARMKLGYVVLTMVDRDDLPGGGAAHVAACVGAISEASPHTLIEVLGGDFRARPEAIALLAHSPASVLAHNIETVARLSPKVRDAKSSYEQSLAVLKLFKEITPEKLSKSSIMLGLGEEQSEVRQTLRDLRDASVDIVTFGQYLQPTRQHLEVARFVHPSEFEIWKQEAEEMDFLFCASGPMVRSSYKAGELFTENYLRSHAAPEPPAEPFGV